MKADKAKIEKLLKTARGQLDGILRMLDQDRYCIAVKICMYSSLRTPAMVLSTAILEVRFTRFAGSKPLFKKE